MILVVYLGSSFLHCHHVGY